MPYIAVPPSPTLYMLHCLVSPRSATSVNALCHPAVLRHQLPPPLAMDYLADEAISTHGQEK